MATRGRPFKTLHPKPPRVKKTRLRLTLKLTPREIKQLKAKAAAEMRSVGGYIAFVIIRDLRRGGGGRRRFRLSARKGQPVSYDNGVLLTAEQRERLERRAGNEARSLSNYVTRLVLDDLRRG